MEQFNHQHNCNNHHQPAGDNQFDSSQEEETLTNEATSDSGEEQKVNVRDPKHGCEHYRRRCQKRCNECKEFFTCRVCHDEVKYHSEWDLKKTHKMDRFSVKEVKCLECDHIQKPQQNCENCKIQFASYFCDKCNLFDDDHEEKEIFHCDGCGICRVGGRDKSFHCDKCECCIDIEYKDDHTCVSLKQDCPVCMQDMHDTRLDVTVPKCGHGMHLECLQQYLKGHIACPICKKSLVNPKYFEKQIDIQIAETPMPAEYKDTKMICLCNDCLTKSCVPFHVLGGKCRQCSSYNTTRVDDSEEEVKKFLQLQQNQENTVKNKS